MTGRHALEEIQVATHRLGLGKVGWLPQPLMPEKALIAIVVLTDCLAACGVQGTIPSTQLV